MRKTRFAGLTELTPGENPNVDNSSLFSENPSITDHFLEIGAVTHRHDAHPGLGTPALAPSGSIQPTGGSFGADVDIALGYTLIDADGGETLISPTTTLSTEPPYDPPESAPRATVTYSSGALMADTFYYGLTLTDLQGGETPLGPIVNVDREPGPTFASITLDGLTADFGIHGAVAWRLYRARSGENFGYIASGTADRFVDSGQGCVDCGQLPPTQNRTNRTNRVQIQIPAAALASGVASGAAGFRVYGSMDGTFTGDCLLGEYPLASGGSALVYTSYSPLRGNPPDVSTSVRGASKIDAETSLTNHHWRSPVANSGLLPATVMPYGETRRALDTGEVYVAFGQAFAGGSGWTKVASGGVKRVGAAGSVALAVDELQLKGSGGVRAEPATRLGASPGSGLLALDYHPPILVGLASGVALDYELGQGTLAVASASGGLVPTVVGEKRVYVKDVVYDDVEAELRFRVMDASTGQAAVIVRSPGSGDGIFAQIDRAAGRLELIEYVGGGSARLDSAPLPAIASGSSYFLRGYARSERVTAGLWDQPPATAPPLALISAPISSPGRRRLARRGRVGARLVPGSTAWSLEHIDVRVAPEAHMDIVEANGVAVHNPLGLRFIGAGVALASGYGGSAVVTITGTGGGGGGGSISQVAVQGGASASSPTSIVFVAGSGASLQLNPAGGSATLTINASAAPGPAGGPGPAGPSGTASSPRQWASAAVNLAAGASGLTGADLGRAYIIHRVTADRPARVRTYVASGYQLADRDRTLTTDPTGEHGLTMDVDLDFSWVLGPPAVGSSQATPTSPAIPVTITNRSASAGVTTVGLEFSRIEQ
jgi:hypothetical protein